MSWQDILKEDETPYFYHPDEHRWGTPEYEKEQREKNKRKDGKEWARVPREKLPTDSKLTDKMKYHIDTVLRSLAFIMSSTLIGPKDSKFLLNTSTILRDIKEEE
tara:strand:+ start:916 stop:1230 length:315 start_codon:yes stop_codon:yes gene_type:complete